MCDNYQKKSMIKDVIDGLVKLLGPIATLSKDKRELKDSALRAISIALDETCIYYRDRRNGSERNMEREGQLVKYWSAAAIPLRHFDEHLSNICDLKAEYWVNPNDYNPTQIEELGIDLISVRNAYKQLSRPYFHLKNRI